MKELAEYRRLLLSRAHSIGIEIETTLEALPEVAVHLPLREEIHPPLAQVFTWTPATPHQLIAHLYWMEAQVFYPAIQKIILAERPILDIPAWVILPDDYSAEVPWQSMSQRYRILRESILEQLENAPRPPWNRTGRQPCFGVRTSQWWVERSLALAKMQLRRIQGR